MQKLLVIRNDKIGDFMVTWPAFAMLKQSLPQTKIVALVPSYTYALAEICPYIDEIILDSRDRNDPAENARVLQAVKKGQFFAMISFVSDGYNAKLAWRSGIPYRLAPATKWFQFVYNHRLTQRRSRSEKPESEYNLDLARQFLRDYHQPIVEPTTPFFSVSAEKIAAQKQKLAGQLGLNPAKKWLFVHSSTGGSATNLSLEQYARLINAIVGEMDCEVILTAGPNESEQARQLLAMLKQPAVIYDKNEGLGDFSYSLACADLFISGSTGPLHICGALNVPTIGFYPSRLSASPLRWQPINDAEKHLAFAAPAGKKTEKNLTLIDIENALTTIIPFVKKWWA